MLLSWLTQIRSLNKKGFVYLLRPTPELWTISLPHRTQILYAPDMSFITMKLNLSPGACVVEAGTGSGSFTHVLARTVARSAPAARGEGQTTNVWHTGDPVAPTPEGPFDGRVYSYEFHADRVDKARAEFTAHGLDRTVILQHRNVCKQGFDVPGIADAVFLDLPAPWEAIPYARDALRSDVATRICCFSPCIEQVLRSVTALSECGFTDVSTYESLIRTHESLTNVAPLEPISLVVKRIRQTEAKRESRRAMQIANSRMERERRQEEALRQAQDEGLGQKAGTRTDVDQSSESQVKRKAEDVEDRTAKRQAVDNDAPLMSQNSDAAAAPQPDNTDLSASAPDLTAESSAEPQLPQQTSWPDGPLGEPPAEMLYSAGFRQKVERRPLHSANVYSRPFPQVTSLSTPADPDARSYQLPYIRYSLATDIALRIIPL